MADMVAKAVKLTDKAVLPFAIELIKLLMLPPGQEATKIIPSATVGVGFIRITNKNVSAGNSRNWEIIPVIAEAGFMTTFLKCSVLMPNATPNIIRAREIFKTNKPEEEKLRRT